MKPEIMARKNRSFLLVSVVALVLGKSGHTRAEDVQQNQRGSDDRAGSNPTTEPNERRSARNQTNDAASNTDPALGPPKDLPSPRSETPSYMEQEDHPYRAEKKNHPYVDIMGAWGWSNRSYLTNICFLNLYLHDSSQWAGFHARFLAPGALTFQRTILAADGTTLNVDRKTTFTIDIFDPNLRAYIIDDVVYLDVGITLGLDFYDGLVPTLDGQVGAGFLLGEWGLQIGIRSSRLPEEAIVVNGNDFINVKYGLQIYANLETSFHW